MYDIESADRKSMMLFQSYMGRGVKFLEAGALFAVDYINAIAYIKCVKCNWLLWAFTLELMQLEIVKF